MVIKLASALVLLSLFKYFWEFLQVLEHLWKMQDFFLMLVLYIFSEFRIQSQDYILQIEDT